MAILDNQSNADAQFSLYPDMPNVRQLARERELAAKTGLPDVILPRQRAPKRSREVAEISDDHEERNVRQCTEASSVPFAFALGFSLGWTLSNAYLLY